MKKFKFLNPVIMPLLLKLDIQYFADGDGGADGGADGGEGGDGGADGGEDGGKDKKPPKVEFTPEQQKELERILGDKLAKDRAKAEKEFAEKLAAAKTEAEKLAAMNAEQKATYEREQREKDIADREAKITHRELRAEALETLAEKGLPKTLADILVFNDAESTKTSLEAVEKSFRAAVEEEVNKRLKGKPPGGGGSQSSTTVNPWSKATRNLTEQARISAENPQLAAQLKASAKN